MADRKMNIPFNVIYNLTIFRFHGCIVTTHGRTNFTEETHLVISDGKNTLTVQVDTFKLRVHDHMYSKGIESRTIFIVVI